MKKIFKKIKENKADNKNQPQNTELINMLCNIVKLRPFSFLTSIISKDL